MKQVENWHWMSVESSMLMLEAHWRLMENPVLHFETTHCSLYLSEALQYSKVLGVNLLPTMVAVQWHHLLVEILSHLSVLMALKLVVKIVVDYANYFAVEAASSLEQERDVMEAVDYCQRFQNLQVV